MPRSWILLVGWNPYVDPLTARIMLVPDPDPESPQVNDDDELPALRLLFHIHLLHEKVNGLCDMPL